MDTLRRLHPVHFAGLLALVVLALGLVACGDDEKSASGSSEQGQKVEEAFLSGMVHHHESAIQMAEIAQRRGQDPFIRKLAEAIITTQDRETGQMRSIHKRLFGKTLKPDSGAHDGLGLTAAEAGMTHNQQTNATLESAEPFDRAFVDEMVPHHLGAIKMAKVVLKDTTDPALKNLAETIIRTQQNEVDGMNAFRERKYGGPAPTKSGAGGGTLDGAEHGAEDEGH